MDLKMKQILAIPALSYHLSDNGANIYLFNLMARIKSCSKSQTNPWVIYMLNVFFPFWVRAYIEC